MENKSSSCQAENKFGAPSLQQKGIVGIVFKEVNGCKSLATSTFNIGLTTVYLDYITFALPETNSKCTPENQWL